MTNESLYALAQIAITIAGFTGLLSFFRTSGDTDRSELVRILYIFVMCFTIVIGCFLPDIVDALFPASHAGWRVATFFVGLVALGISIRGLTLFMLQHLTLSLPIASYAMGILCGLIGLALLGASLGVLPGSMQGFLLVGLLWFLLYSGYVFVTTLVWGTGNKANEDG